MIFFGSHIKITIFFCEGGVIKSTNSPNIKFCEDKIYLYSMCAFLKNDVRYLCYPHNKLWIRNNVRVTSSKQLRNKICYQINNLNLLKNTKTNFIIIITMLSKNRQVILHTPCKLSRFSVFLKPLKTFTSPYILIFFNNAKIFQNQIWNFFDISSIIWHISTLIGKYCNGNHYGLRDKVRRDEKKIQ